MKNTRLGQQIGWLPLLIALGVALAMLTIIAMSALFARHSGIPQSEPALGNIIAVARSYQFRNALKNTAFVLALPMMSIVLLGWLVYRPRSKPALRRQWPTTALLALAITPLFLPVPFAVTLWQPLLERVDVVSQPDLARLIVACVQIWRLWPLVIVLASLTRGAGAFRSAITVALTAALLILLDVATPLIATGGEPFNETHLWSTWSFHTVWVARHWSFGAVMYAGLAVVTAAIGIVLLLVLPRKRQGNERGSVVYGRPVPYAVLLFGAVSACLPLVLTLTYLIPLWNMSETAALLRSNYAFWAANSVLILAGASLLAGIIALPARSQDGARRTSLFAICFVSGLAVTPVWDWVGLRLAPWSSPWSVLAGCMLVAGMTAGLIAVWPVSISIGAAHNTREDGAGIARIVLAVAALFTGNQIALSLAAGESQSIMTIGAGSALQLIGRASPVTMTLAAVVTYGLTFTGVALAIQAFTRQNRVASHLKD